MVEGSRIGLSHSRFGEAAGRDETTGRSEIGRQYMEALHSWLEEDSSASGGVPGQEALKVKQRVKAWLGDRSEEKVGLADMLLARLPWSWRSLEDCRRGGALGELEFQVERMDICSYAFPQNIEGLIQGIGKLEPVTAFEGCGAFNAEIQSFVSEEFSRLCEWLEADELDNGLGLGKKEPLKAWLVACLAKTMKESVHLSSPVPDPGTGNL